MTREERDRLEQLQVAAGRLTRELAELDDSIELAAMQAAEASAERMEAYRAFEETARHDELTRLGAVVTALVMVVAIFRGLYG